MMIKVNGEDYITDKLFLSEILSDMGVIPERVAVELNLKVIKRADISEQILKEGDIVEIVNFVGGGNLMTINLLN